MKSTSLILLLTLSLSLPGMVCFAQGTLDPTFGNSGKVITSFSPGNSNPSYSAMQPDGKIVVAGSLYYTNIDSQFVLARYKTDGGLDSSFGSKGMFTGKFNIPYSFNQSVSIALLPDKKIIVAAFIADSSYIAVARYSENGHQDPSFGKNGNKIIGANFSALAAKVVLTANNKIMLAALKKDIHGNSSLVLICLNNNGTMDASFGNDGLATIPIADYPSYVRLNTITSDQDGNFIIGGSIGHDVYNNRYDYLLIRCKSSGEIDPSFGDGGKVITPNQNYNTTGITDIAVQPDKKIVVTGDQSTLGLSNVLTNFMLVRYTQNGALDSSFGNNGTVITAFSGKNSNSNALAIEPDNKLIVSGADISMSDYSQYFALVKYDANGTPDASFGNNGQVETGFGLPAGGNFVILQPDNKIVQVGFAGVGIISEFALARFNNTSALAITLSSFSATIKPSSVLLSWQTVAEENNAYFAIERGNDNDRILKQIGTVNSKGNSNQLQQYSFEDLAPVTGRNYYRLKQVDKDGTVSYTKTVFVDFAAASTISFYPNPVKDIITFTGLNADTQTTLSIIDIKGRVLVKQTINSATWSWNVKQLSAGSYYVRIEAGNKAVTLNFIKE
jgi:uncharacterized delta-60 repeat protein